MSDEEVSTVEMNTISLSRTGMRERAARVFTYPRIARTAGRGRATAISGTSVPTGTLAPGSEPGLL